MAPDFNPNQMRLPGMDVPRPVSGVAAPIDTSNLSGANKIMDEYLLKQDKVLAGWGDLNNLVEQHANTLQSIFRVNQGIAGTNEKMVQQTKERATYTKQIARDYDEQRKGAEALRKAEEQVAKLRAANDPRKWRAALKDADMVHEGPSGSRDVILSGIQGQAVQRIPMARVQEILQKQASGQVLTTAESQIFSKMGANIQRDMAGKEMGVGLDTFTQGGLVGKGKSAVAIAGGALSGHMDMAALGSLVGDIGPVGLAIGGAYEGWKRIIGPALAAGRQATQLGQISGQGLGAGISAKWEAMTMGANPFDMITGATAMAIVKGVREAGFSGEVARQVDQGVKGTIEDLGISVDSSIKMITTAMRQGGESISQITSEMKNFDDAARHAGESVQQYTDNIQANADALRGAGAGSTATSQATALENIFTAKSGFPNGGKDVATFITNPANAGILAAMSGTGANPMTAGPQVFTQGWQVMTGRLIDQALSLTNGNVTQAANFLSRSGSPFFSGMPANQVQSYIRLHQTKPTGVTDAYKLEQASKSYLTNYESLAHRMAVERVRAGLSFDQIDALTSGRSATKEEQIQRLTHLFEHHPEGLSDTWGIGPGSIKGMDRNQLEAIRLNAVKRASPFLTKAGIEDLTKHESDLRDNFYARLQRDLLKHQRSRKSQSGDTVSAYPGDSIIVTVDPKTKKLSLSTDPSQNYNRAASFGETPSNARPASLRPAPGMDLRP